MLPRYFEFEVELKGIRPRIWRRFGVAEDATFLGLHRAIQDAFGWTDTHLWEFAHTGRRGEAIASPSGDDLPMDFEPTGDGANDAATLALRSFFTPRGPRRCRYVYDFGDLWEHDVSLNARVELPETFGRRLLGGARSCPPEDCGGPPGYANWCAFVRTGTHPWMSATEAKDWLGDWTPDAFDLQEARRDFDQVARSE